MDEHCDTMETEEGIIVDTSLDILRKAAKKVLFEFNEKIYDMDGELRPADSEIRTGDTVLFEEKIQPCPARIIAIKIIRNFWYLNATSETPKSGYPSGRDAMKAAEMDEQNLRILERFLISAAGADHVKEVRKWKPDLKGEAVDVLGLIGSATKKWS
ncbi:MAG: hypothetical protein AM325_001365 [Candidatus Thorarchaeota archaeon SMTZ1-45]|nr:MAG: hypothetical protein AM325_03185 [Candidatus Thorarchaeota archaeon SMTZ1-45]